MAGQGDDYLNGYLLDYVYFKNYYKIMATDLRKQQELNADPKATQQINFTENLDQVGQKSVYSITEEAKNPFIIKR